jgi:hypothetical protein
MDQETSNEIAGQVNKAVSEFREEASKTDIAPIVKDLQRALEEQSQKTSTAEDYMQSSVESEKAVFADITRLSNSLGGILETQRGILESLKGLNDNIDTTSQQQNTEISGGAGNNSLGGGSVASAMMGVSGYGRGATFDGTMGTGEGLTEEKNQAITDFAEKYNINPNALAGILNVESNFDTSIKGGAGGNYSGIFQLQSQQIAGLTESVFGDALTPEEYRNLSFEDQLKVYEQYMLNAVGDEGEMKDFFTGDAEQDTSRLWALQLAPGNAKNIDYNNPNALISDTRQAGVISAPGGGVTVGSAVGSLSRGGLLETENAILTPLSLNWIGEELPEGITEGLNQTTLSDPISGESFPVEFEVENVEGKFITTGPVTLTEDTDLEGVSGGAGEPVEVSAEIAQELAGQIGATIESADPVESLADPVESLADPVESLADHVDGAGGNDTLEGGLGNDLVESPADPVESLADPVESLADPVESPADPVESLADPDNLAPEEEPAYLEDLDISDSDTLTLEEETPAGVSRSTADPEESVIFDSNTITPEEEEAADLEPTDISDYGTLIPEVAPTPIDLEIEPTVVDDASNTERNVESQGQPSQTAAADYSESKTTPIQFTGLNWQEHNWQDQVKYYFVVA